VAIVIALLWQNRRTPPSVFAPKPAPHVETCIFEATLRGIEMRRFARNDSNRIVIARSGATKQSRWTKRERDMDLGLRGRKALITGASKGIGRACAEVLAEEGCDIVLVSRTASDLDAVRAKIAGEHNVAVRYYALDLSDSKNVDRLAAECPDTDLLVNNAGAIPGGNIAQIDEARWREAWDLKVFGYINMTRRFYALMAARRHGVIVNILGAAGENPDFEYVAGSSGNASLMAFTRAIGGTAPRDNLRVMGINPGPVMTERLITLMKTRAQTNFGDPEKYTELMKPLAFGRAAKPEEIGYMAAFLASDRSAYTTGSIVTIDGGGGSRRSAL